MSGTWNPSSVEQRRSTRPVQVAAVAAVSAAVMVPAHAAGAAERPAGGEHCVVHTHGMADSGALIADEPVCFATLAEALASIGADVDAVDRSLSMSDVVAEDLLATASTFTLGVHYDGFNRTSSSITVTGSDCSGGYVNLSSSWVNRISSTLNGCPQVNFWDGYDKTGSVEAASYNLTTLNNLSNSVQYLGS